MADTSNPLSNLWSFTYPPVTYPDPAFENLERRTRLACLRLNTLACLEKADTVWWEINETIKELAALREEASK